MDDGANEVTLNEYDTPTSRASINQVSTEELDAWLEQIRARRLQQVQKLEAIARVKSDEVRLELFIKYERLYTKARKALTKLEAEEQKAEKAVHACRMVVMAINMEVGADDEGSC